MMPVFGPGVRLDDERRRAFRAPLTDLPTGNRLILPVCPAGDEADWSILPEGRAIQRFTAVAVSTAQSRVVEAPAAGVVGKTEMLPLPGRGTWQCVWMDADEPAKEPRRSLNRAAKRKPLPAQILRTADAAGLIDETDGQPVADKLRRFCERGITLLACDAVCDDPYNADNLCALLEETEDIADGLTLAAAVCGNVATRVVTARASDAGLQTMRRLRRRLDVPLTNAVGRYPLWPNLLRQKPFAGQKVGRLGAQACARLARAVRLSQPPRRVIVTVSGTAVREPQLFRVTIGTPLQDVLNQCATGSDGYRQVAVGSAITGHSVGDPALVPVLQDTRCILAFRAFPDRPRVCIGCGRCAAVCPADVFPTAAIRAVQRGEHAHAALYGAGNCIGCGACEVVCPARLHIRDLLRGDTLPQPAESWRNRSE